MKTKKKGNIDLIYLPEPFIFIYSRDEFHSMCRRVFSPRLKTLINLKLLVPEVAVYFFVTYVNVYNPAGRSYGSSVP